MPVSDRCASQSAIHFALNSLPTSGSGRNDAENVLFLPDVTVPTMRSAGISTSGSEAPETLETPGKASSSTVGYGERPCASSSLFSRRPALCARRYSSFALPRIISFDIIDTSRCVLHDC